MTDPVRYVEFRGGRFLARLFLILCPVIGLRRAEHLMAWLITHPPFYRKEADR